jgi:succinate dehydrogenase/fumarate reductase flavoprotein subunit
MSTEQLIETDVLVIGGGTAGNFAAIAARERGLDVTIVDKAYAGKSGCSIMASGFWSVFNPEWGHDLNACLDFVNAGADYINDREWTQIVLEDSYQTYVDLCNWGVEFPVGKEERESRDWYKKVMGLEDMEPGRASVEPPYYRVPLRHRGTTPYLRRQSAKVGVKVMDRTMITELLLEDGRAVGAIGFPMDSNVTYVFKAKAVVLTAGGNNFRSPGYHTNSLAGDADAMAYRAGATITSKEFQEDHHFNLASYPAWKSTGEIYPILWSFTDSEGKFLSPIDGGFNYAMFPIHEGRGPIIWDLSFAGPKELEAVETYLDKRGNRVEIERIGLDPAAGGKYPIIGGSAAGTSLPQTGGVWPVDKSCATDVPGLYVGGDCCCTRCWGAHYFVTPGGLSPAAATGKRAGNGAADYASQQRSASHGKPSLDAARERMQAPANRNTGFDARWVIQQLQNAVMPYYVLYLKKEDRLKGAITTVEFLRDKLIPKIRAKDMHELRLGHEAANMALNAEMILKASLFRTESRGLHYREDFPTRRDPEWLAWTKIKEEGGSMMVSKEPLPKEWWPDLSMRPEELYLGQFPVIR